MVRSCWLAFSRCIRIVPRLDNCFVVAIPCFIDGTQPPIHSTPDTSPPPPPANKQTTRQGLPRRRAGHWGRRKRPLPPWCRHCRRLHRAGPRRCLGPGLPDAKGAESPTVRTRTHARPYALFFLLCCLFSLFVLVYLIMVGILPCHTPPPPPHTHTPYHHTPHHPYPSRPSVGVPMTAAQLERQGWAALVDRLVGRREHFLALRICEYLRCVRASVGRCRVCDVCMFGWGGEGGDRVVGAECVMCACLGGGGGGGDRVVGAECVISPLPPLCQPPKIGTSQQHTHPSISLGKERVLVAWACAFLHSRRALAMSDQQVG